MAYDAFDKNPKYAEEPAVFAHNMKSLLHTIAESIGHHIVIFGCRAQTRGYIPHGNFLVEKYFQLASAMGVLTVRVFTIGRDVRGPHGTHPQR